MNPFFSLPDAPLLQGRQAFVLDACRNKRVLHLGCVDSGLTVERFTRGELLHQKLSTVTDDLWGVDVDADGVDFLHRQGFDHLLIADIAHSPDVVQLLRTQNFDVVLATEVLEHLANPGAFLAAVSRLMAPQHTLFIVTVPNAFRVGTLLWMWRGVEFVHPDHNYWFSFATITSLLRKAGFSIDQLYPYAYELPHILPSRRHKRSGSPTDHTGSSLSSSAGSEGAHRSSRRSPASYFQRLPEQILAALLYRRTPFWGDGLLVVATVNEHAGLD